MTQKFSAEQMLGRWEDLREIKNLMGRYSADYVLKKEKEMFKVYWSRRDDVCLGVNDGYFAGAEAVADYYEDHGKLIAIESEMIQKAFPKELGGKSAEEVYGVGMMDYKPVDTSVLEIAEDGNTAKGLWCLRGSHSRITPGGPQALWEWGWFAVDFILEEGDWKIWHMLYLQDVLRPCGSPWTAPEKVYPERPEFAAIRKFKMAAPNKPCRLHEYYSAERAYSPSPRVPEPYVTFAETFSYGIKGGTKNA